MLYYIVYSYDAYNCSLRIKRFSSYKDAERHFELQCERSILAKVQGNKETLIKERKIDA